VNGQIWLSAPDLTDKLSGAGHRPCPNIGRLAEAQHPAGTAALASEVPATWPVALDAPSDVSLVGLRSALRVLSALLSPSVQFLVDLTDFERRRPTPLELCAWADQLQPLVQEARSTATLLDHACDVIWEQASRESGDRRERELDAVRPAQTPRPCPVCRGAGVLGRDEFGNWDGCDTCEGTGIDPSDPASPL
jgi:hypothetical protein